MTGPANDRLSCFVSYASEHLTHARFLRRAINPIAHGRVELFLASDPSCIPAGKPWYDEIVAALRGCGAFFILLSLPPPSGLG